VCILLVVCTSRGTVSKSRGEKSRSWVVRLHKAQVWNVSYKWL